MDNMIKTNPRGNYRKVLAICVNTDDYDGGCCEIHFLGPRRTDPSAHLNKEEVIKLILRLQEIVESDKLKGEKEMKIGDYQIGDYLCPVCYGHGPFSAHMTECYIVDVTWDGSDWNEDWESRDAGITELTQIDCTHCWAVFDKPYHCQNAHDVAAAVVKRQEWLKSHPS